MGRHPRRQDELGAQDRGQRNRGDVAVVLVNEPRACRVAQQEPHPLAQPPLPSAGTRESGVACEHDSSPGVERAVAAVPIRVCLAAGLASSLLAPLRTSTSGLGPRAQRRGTSARHWRA